MPSVDSYGLGSVVPQYRACEPAAHSPERTSTRATVSDRNLQTRQAIEYSWRQLAVRAGVPKDYPQSQGMALLGIPVYYSQPEEVTADPAAIVIVPCVRSAFSSIRKRTADRLDWIAADKCAPPGASLPFHGSLPVLFWGKNAKSEGTPFAELRSDGMLIFYADIIASTLFMLTRWEETVVPVRDEHDRFPASASVAYRQGFLDQPIVDQYALILRAWLRALLPGWEPETQTFSVKLSHDIDHLRRFPHASNALRTVSRDLLKHRNLQRAVANSAEAITQCVTPRRTSYFKGIELLADWSCEYGLGNDAFYFMASGPGPTGGDYSLASEATRGIIDRLRAQGFEIGLHAGYDTLGKPERLAEEKTRLDDVLGCTRYGGRQHYLRFRVPDTWRHWEEAGLAYDSTMGYADHEGFRCGTCHPFRPFDLERNVELNVWEHPLIVMDTTLIRYRKLSPDQAEKRIFELAHRCKQVEGTFTLLWHNSSLSGEWRKWRKIYRRSIQGLAEAQGVGMHAGRLGGWRGLEDGVASREATS